MSIKPVEIEFLMKDSLSGGLDKAGQSVEKLADRAKTAAALINAKIEEQHKVIDGVAADLNRMEKQLAGMKPGTAQRELAKDVVACRKVLDEERVALAALEQQHREAEKAVNELAKEHDNLAGSGEQAAVSQQSLAARIAESKALIKGTQADIRELEKAYKSAAPGNAQAAALAELNSAKKALEEEKTILASLTAEQERNKESNKRLSMQLRELQDAMAKMRLEGRQDSEEYRRMASDAANLADTIADLRTQTSILSNDDANLQGLMSGVSGLSGMFTAATGALSLFASENENLAKVQARVQSVMAITMGLQQVFNTLNKDSAFRLVTVTKMKNLLTAANARLAASLGISTVAAQALMATLTLGLSAVITGLIVLWNKYSDAQEEAARKAQETVEIESDGRAQMIKTRFEIDNTIRSLKEFSGSKEEEKQKVEELNRKYGEAFGYYDTVAEWYDVLTQKADDYIQMLFLQAKVQAMVNKAVEADEEYNKIKATKPENVKSSMGLVSKLGLLNAQAHTGGKIDARAEIGKYNMDAWQKELDAAAAKRDGILKEAEELTQKRAQIGKDSNIGGHVKPESHNTPGSAKASVNRQKEHEREMTAERQRAQELMQLRRENDAAETEVMNEGLQKKLRQIDNDYQARKDKIEKQAADWKRENKEAGRGEGLSADQQNETDRALELSEQKREKEQAEAYQEEMAAMRDYLKEYGTFQQQKLAIAEEYSEKIRKAQNEGERQTLEKQKAAALQRVEVEALKQEIDWKGLLGDFGGLLEEQIKPTLEKLRAYAGSDEFREADVNDQQTIYNLISQLEAKTSEGWNGMFRNLGEAVQQVADAELKYKEAKEKSTQADKEYADAVKRNTVQGKNGDYVKDDKGEVAAAFEKSKEAADELAKAQTDLADANNGVSDAANRVRENMNNLVNGLQQLGSGSMSGILGGADSIARIFGENDLKGEIAKRLSTTVGGAFGTALAGPIGGEIVEGVFSLLDLFKDGIENLFTSIIDTILGAVDGLLKSVLSLDIPVAIGKSLVDGVGSILDTVTFGGFSSWMDDSNAKEVQATINRLTDRNEKLQTSIEDLTDEIKSGKGTKSVAAYRDAYKYQQERNANYLQIAQAQAGYHGSHHSWNYYWRGYSQEQIDKLSEQIGRQWDGNLWNLSPEEMRMLRSNVDMWTQIENTGKGGYGNSVAEKLSEYIDQAGRLGELTDQLYEGLTSISFDSMYGSFVDKLMDMKYDAKAAAGDISEYFMRAMISNKIGEMYSDKLKEWWEKFGKAMEDNDLTEAERKALADEYMKYVDEAIKLRDNIAAATGYNPNSDGGTSQSAKAGGFVAMTQDQGTKLEGMFTSGLQHWSSMDEKMENVSEKMNAAENHLARIEENTGKSAEHLEQIAENMVKIIRDGLKVR